MIQGRKHVMINEAIILDHVSKKFKDQVVLKETSLTLEKGKIHGIIGVNGSGKTVLMKIICGFLKPDTGTVTVNGVMVGKERDFAPDIGVIIETPGFISYESGFRNLKNLAMIRKHINDDEIRKSMEMVGLDPDDKKRTGKYSLGMRQRLAIAQAIMEHPSLLVLDEPMNALDREGVKQIRDLLLRLKSEGVTIVIASHLKEDIEILCDTVCEMENGNLLKVTGW